MLLVLLNRKKIQRILRSTGNFFGKASKIVYRVRATEGVVEARNVSHERSFVRFDAVHDIFFGFGKRVWERIRKRTKRVRHRFASVELV